MLGNMVEIKKPSLYSLQKEGKEPDGKPKKRVLVADDEPKINRFIEISLGVAGFNAFFSKTVQEALDEMAKQDFQVVVADLKFIGEDDEGGLKIIAKAKKRGSYTILSSAGSKAKTLTQELIDRGVDEVLPKPFHPDELVKILKKMMPETNQQISQNQSS